MRTVLALMACPDCQRRSALIATVAPAISRLSLRPEHLLELLALPNEQLLHAAKVENPKTLLRHLELPAPTESVPTALCRHDPDYPEALAQLECAPAVLYATCTTERLRELRSKPTVAIIGDREYTPFAWHKTFELSRDLAAAGATVISGMNRGLEGTVHHHGMSIAVMPASPEIPYPRQNKAVHGGILAHGAAISEFPPEFFPPEPWCFIASQRIIPALASVVVIVEVRRHYGVPLPVQIATDLGVEVAVIPGRVTDPGGEWLFALLRDGAHPISCAQDVLKLIYHGRELRGMAASVVGEGEPR